MKVIEYQDWKIIKCKECILLSKCPSGQRCSKLIKDFKRLCPFGKTNNEE